MQIGSIVYLATLVPQQSEINDQLEITDIVTTSPNENKNAINNSVIIIAKAELNENKIYQPTTQNTEGSFSVKAYKFFAEPIITVIRTPKVNLVLRNIGTCIVNGAMELFSYYLPPTFMPLVASAAGFMIPFEPVVMLKERMPVNTYRRAFKTAMKTFLDSFSQFKYDDEIDPYMTRRFNRRFMDDDTKKPRRE
ncbi:unnamed protein product [Arctia plantaginis]|uniref:Uncharacterized protein n=1 Tax=Arctia plantaginis TaxID=874455 RepID=A0A8S0ZYM7_ARCPL|nr:unnamed protein product [Arctia plantaginis]